MNAVVPNAWLSAPAAAAVSFSAAPVSVIVPPVVSVFRALRSIDRIATRVPPTSADSCGLSLIVIWKSVRATEVVPRVSEIPPEWLIVPANVFASSSPPVIGNASASEPIGAAVMLRLCSALAAPGSSVTVVAPPVSSTVFGRACTITLPSFRPRLNSFVWNVALSALAAGAVSATFTPVIR